MLPNAEVLQTALGLLNSGELVKLKNSARNCSLARSVSEKFLNSDRSEVNRCGPWSRFRPALPYTYCAGRAKLVLTMQLVRCPRPQSDDGGPIRSGRCTPWELVFARSVEIDTLNGRPVCSVMIPLSCQRANAVFTI